MSDSRSDSMNSQNSHSNSPLSSPNKLKNNKSKIKLKMDIRSRIRKQKIKDGLIRLFRIIFSTIYLIYIILTIPLSFEIGGLNCGLSYSLTILILYFCLATLRVLKYHRIISSFLYYLQHLLLPTLLSFFLTIFKSNNEIIIDSFYKKIWWTYIIKFWKTFLINSTPLFTILEGFCSLLSIQAIGQTSKYFIKYKSDTWSIINLIVSSCILSTSLYFVFKIYVSPLDLNQVGLISASLLGSTFTCTILISIFGIYFNKSTTLESSLMVAYIVKCCYELFPELSKKNISSLFKFVFNEFKKIDNQAKNSLQLNNEFNLLKFNLLKLNRFSAFFNKNYFLNEIYLKFLTKFPTATKKILNFYEIFKLVGNIIIKFIIENFPNSFEPLWDFLKISINNLTFSILFQLAYRICVFFAATKIIPILSPINKLSPLNSPTNEKPAVKNTKNVKKQSTSSRLIYLYSPCIIIAVYTNLMIQYNDEFDEENHFWNWLKLKIYDTTAASYSNSNSTANLNLIDDSSVHAWQFWNWINIFAVLLLYFSELLSYDPEDSSLTDHWNS